MANSQADLILHPLRFRIIEALTGGDPMTPQELLTRLSDVAKPTLYRHLKLLNEAGLVIVAGERPVRGVVERSYALGSLPHSPADLLHADRKSQFRYFATFVSMLLQQFSEYLDRREIDLIKDGVGYRQLPIYATDEEFLELARKLSSVLAEASQRSPEGRIRRRFTTIVMPARQDDSHS